MLNILVQIFYYFFGINKDILIITHETGSHHISFKWAAIRTQEAVALKHKKGKNFHMYRGKWVICYVLNTLF